MKTNLSDLKSAFISKSNQLFAESSFGEFDLVSLPTSPFSDIDENSLFNIYQQTFPNMTDTQTISANLKIIAYESVFDRGETSKLIDLPSMKEENFFINQTDNSYELDLSEDGNRLLKYNDKDLEIWDIYLSLIHI